MRDGLRVTQMSKTIEQTEAAGEEGEKVGLGEREVRRGKKDRK